MPNLIRTIKAAAIMLAMAASACAQNADQNNGRAAARTLVIANCRNATMSAAGDVTALCRGADGTERVSALQSAGTCTSTITGITGQLTCTRGAVGPTSAHTGSGPLQIAGCRDVTVSAAGDATARCTHPDGTEHVSTLQSVRTCTSVIANVNGSLACARAMPSVAGQPR